MKGRISAFLVSLSIFAALSMLITFLAKRGKLAKSKLSSSNKGDMTELDRRALYAPEPSRIRDVAGRIRSLTLRAGVALSVLGLGAIIAIMPTDGSWTTSH